MRRWFLSVCFIALTVDAGQGETARLGIDSVLAYSRLALDQSSVVRSMAADHTGNVYVLGESWDVSGLPVTTVLGANAAPVSWVMKLSSAHKQL